jgi:hypothetical protein
MAAFLSTVLAIFKAIPILQLWFDGFVKLYVERTIDNMKSNIRDGIKKALADKDQRDLEKAYNNPRAGELDDANDSEVRDNLPGVDP